jgi:hypothetical protein
MKPINIPFSLVALQKVMKLHSPEVDVSVRLGKTKKEVHIKASFKGVSVKVKKRRKG